MNPMAAVGTISGRDRLMNRNRSRLCVAVDDVSLTQVLYLLDQSF